MQLDFATKNFCFISFLLVIFVTALFHIRNKYKYFIYIISKIIPLLSLLTLILQWRKFLFFWRKTFLCRYQLKELQIQSISKLNTMYNLVG